MKELHGRMVDGAVMNWGECDRCGKFEFVPDPANGGRWTDHPKHECDQLFQHKARLMAEREERKGMIERLDRIIELLEGKKNGIR